MATGNDTSVIPEDYLEERILNGLFNSPFCEYESLVDSWKGNIDTRMMKQRSLLHVAVSLGKVDWVEGLLLRGADTNLHDEGKESPMTTAEEMQRRYPEDRVRAEVLRLVRLVNKNKQAMNVSENRGDAGEQRNEISDGAPANVTEEFQSDIIALQASNKEIKEKIASLITKVEELQGAIGRRDTLLECLEGAVTFSAEKLNSLNERLETLFPAKTEETNLDLIEAMMRKTEILDRDEEKEASVRSVYKRLHDEHEITATILKFLVKQPQFKAVVDCNSTDIGTIIPVFQTLSFSNHDVYKGRRLNSLDWSSFADFSNSNVYLGGKVGVECGVKNVSSIFVRSLTQMALYLAFQNRGLPYQSSDREAMIIFSSAFSEAEAKRMSWELDINIVMSMTERERPIEFAPIIPSIIAFMGCNSIESVLRKQVPQLLDFFMNHVVSTLLAKAMD